MLADDALLQNLDKMLRAETQFFHEICSWEPAVLGRSAG
jgi:hypothetical protein